MHCHCTVRVPQKADCDDADKSDDSASPPVPTRYVMGRQRDLDFVEPPFTLKPLERDARGGGADAEAKRLQDHGESRGAAGDASSSWLLDASVSARAVNILCVTAVGLTSTFCEISSATGSIQSKVNSDS